MKQEVRYGYAFYRESSPSFEGNPTYAGPSNGMERVCFGMGNDGLEKCEKLMVAARKNNRRYQVLRYEYRPFEEKARIHVLHSHGVPNPKKRAKMARANKSQD